MKKIHTYACLLLLFGFSSTSLASDELTTGKTSDVFVAVKENDLNAVKAIIHLKNRPNASVYYDKRSPYYDDEHDGCFRGGVLEVAAFCNRIDIVRELIKNKYDESHMGSGDALVLATQKGHIEVVRELLKGKCSVSYIAQALELAVQEGYREIKRELKKELKKADSAQLNKALIESLERGCPSAAKRLIQVGADVNQKVHEVITKGDCDWDVYTTVLEYAAERGYRDVVKEALKKEYPINDIGKAFISAAGGGHTALVKELLKENLKVDTINNALIFAAKRGHVGVVREIMKKDSADNSVSMVMQKIKAIYDYFFHTNKEHLDVALVKAADGLHFEVIKLLIRAGAYVNHTDVCGNTPLMLILNNGCYRSKRAKKNGTAETVQILLHAGADVNHSNNQGETALVRAIRQHDLDAVQILLQIPGININYVDDNGNTPLIIAVEYVVTTYISGRKDQYADCVNSQKIVEELLKASGINPHHANKKGDTAISLLEKKTNRYARYG